MTVLAFPRPAEPRTLSDGDVAKLVRRDLKAAFPSTKFRVYQSRGVSTINVRWIDGPSVAAVGAITGKFIGRGFDGMTDSTFYEPPFMLAGELVRTYCSVNTRRDQSPRFVERVIAALVAKWGFQSTPVASGPCAIGSSYVVATAAQDQEAFTRTGNYWNQLVWRAAEDRRTAEWGNS